MDVVEFADCIKQTVNSITNVKVKGEVGKITKSSSGHTYFDLIGENARVSCVAWSSYKLQPSQGIAEVIVKKVDYYPPYGRCQAVVCEINHFDEEANVAAKRGNLIDSLTAHGFIHRTRLQIPEIVNHLCIITSDDSAAYHDMMEGINKRWPGLRTTVIHSSVQGKNAVSTLKKAFENAYSLQPNIIICGRGGGSEADLEVFNEEEVVRCFINDKIPVISAVGHENDNCICDLVADVRAKTPTASIEICIPQTLDEKREKIQMLKKQNYFQFRSKFSLLQTSLLNTRQTCNDVAMNMRKKYKQYIQFQRESMVSSITNKLEKNTVYCEQTGDKLKANLKTLILKFQHDVDTKRAVLLNIMKHKLSFFKHNVCMVRSELNTYSIDAHISNGACVLLSDNNKIINTVDKVSENDQLCVVLPDGKIYVTVKNVRKRKRENLWDSN